MVNEAQRLVEQRLEQSRLEGQLRARNAAIQQDAAKPQTYYRGFDCKSGQVIGDKPGGAAHRAGRLVSNGMVNDGIPLKQIRGGIPSLVQRPATAISPLVLETHKPLMPIKVFFLWTEPDAPEGDGIYVGGDRRVPQRIADNIQFSLGNFETKGFVNTGQKLTDFSFAYTAQEDNTVVYFYKNTSLVTTKNLGGISDTVGNYSGGGYFVVNQSYGDRLEAVTSGNVTIANYYNLNGNTGFQLTRTVTPDVSITLTGSGSRVFGLLTSIAQVTQSTQVVSVDNLEGAGLNYRESEDWKITIPYGNVLITTYYKAFMEGSKLVRDTYYIYACCISLNGASVITEDRRLIYENTSVTENSNATFEFNIRQTATDSIEFRTPTNAIILRKITRVQVDNVKQNPTIEIHPSLQTLTEAELNEYVISASSPALTQIINNISYTVTLQSTTEAKVQIFNANEETYKEKTVKIAELPSIDNVYAALYHP